MSEFVASFPSAKVCVHNIPLKSSMLPSIHHQETVPRVLARLESNFSEPPCTVETISAHDFIKREALLRTRFAADLDHKQKISKAWSQLHEMKNQIDSGAFLLGRVCTAWSSISGISLHLLLGKGSPVLYTVEKRHL
jgi:hypothetical protein